MSTIQHDLIGHTLVSIKGSTTHEFCLTCNVSVEMPDDDELFDL